MPEKCFCTHQMGLHWFNTGNCTECGCTLFHPDNWPDWPTDESASETTGQQVPVRKNEEMAGFASIVRW